MANPQLMPDKGANERFLRFNGAHRRKVLRVQIDDTVPPVDIFSQYDYFP